jgi:hypothetical protein
MHRALLPIFMMSLTGCLFTRPPVEAPDSPCQDDVRCPAGTREVPGCPERADVKCEVLNRCDGSTLSCQQNPECAPAKCNNGDEEIGRCSTSTPDGTMDSPSECAIDCDEGGCYPVDGCGEIVYCLSQGCVEPQECNANQDTVENCPGEGQGVNCELRTRCDGSTFACIDRVACNAPANCPSGFEPVEQCDLSEPTCQEVTQCGKTIFCQASLCDRTDKREVCKRLGGNACADGDSGCIPVNVCSTEVSCGFKEGCAPQRAIAAGRCQDNQQPLWRWTGTECKKLNGCGCISSSDCGALYRSREACESAHSHCR